MTVEVTVDAGDGAVVATADAGDSLMDIAMEEDLLIPFGCTAARCGVCQVEVVDGALAPADELEQGTLDQFRCAPTVRLACQAKLLADVSLRPVN